MTSSHIEWPWQLYTGNRSIICHLWYLLNPDRNSSRAFQAPWYPRVMRKSHVSQRMVTPRNLEVRNPSNAALQVSLSPSNPTFSPLRGSFGQIFYWGQHGVNFHPIIPHFACTEPAWPRTFCPPMVPAAWQGHPSELTGLTLHIWLNELGWYFTHLQFLVFLRISSPTI